MQGNGTVTALDSLILPQFILSVEKLGFCGKIGWMVFKIIIHYCLYTGPCLSSLLFMSLDQLLQVNGGALQPQLNLRRLLTNESKLCSHDVIFKFCILL